MLQHTILALLSLLGALLLFTIQPMAAKYALPLLGGAPGVWNACMVFFQALLLGGYYYAHLLAKHARLTFMLPLHAAILMIAVFACLPLRFAEPSGMDPAVSPLLWLFMFLGTSVALPFFLISATSPLLQTAHARMKQGNPYMLYAVSNAGSFIALLGYPFLLEPSLTLDMQAQWFSAGFSVLAILFILLAVIKPRHSTIQAQQASSPISRRQLAWWIGLSFVPSSLLYGVTSHIVTDVASAPLLWVIPLALYLLTFIVAFTDKPSAGRIALRLQPALMLFLVFLHLSGLRGPWAMAIHLLAFFMLALACHTRLYEKRPPASQLTHFYLILSLGGVLGGLFNTLVAPFIFTSVTEYPLMLAASFLICANTLEWRSSYTSFTRLLLCLLLPGASLALASIYSAKLPNPLVIRYAIIGMGLLMTYIALSERRPVYGLAMLAIWLGFPALSMLGSPNPTLYAERNFFGVNIVSYVPELNATRFINGITLHGLQSHDEKQRLRPIAYYGPPLAEAYNALPETANGHDMALLGMGAGIVSCYGKAGQDMDIYEIDPAVLHVAQDPALFTYMRDCPPRKHVHLGDARLMLHKAKDGQYGFMVIDVFSSDAIPVHLATREAFQLYTEKLAPHGLIAFHITNRYLDLRPVLSAIANSLGMSVRFRQFNPPHADLEHSLDFPSRWAVMARSPEDLAALSDSWQRFDQFTPQHLWTDNYSNILSAMHLFSGTH